MSINRRSFLAMMAATVPALIAACGATATPTPLPRPTTPALGPVLPPGTPGQGPRFSVDRTAVDFGNVKFDRMVTASFKVTNMGTWPLVLKVPPTVRAEVGCWPGPIVVGQTTLSANQSTTINTDVVMHEGMGGQHIFVIDVTTNDPAQPLANLKVTSNWVK